MTVRDQMFLYCLLVYEHQNEGIFDCLPPDRVERLKKETKKFERFPREVRLTLLMKLIAYVVNKVRNPRLEMMHPSWVAEALRNESPRMITALLQPLPEEFQKRVLQLLGLPELLSGEDGIPDEIAEAAFQILCSQFAAMRLPLGGPELSLETVYLFREEDLMTLMKHVGVREMAWAFVLAGMNALAALVTRFPADLKTDFLDGVKSARQDPDRQKLAARRVGKYDPAALGLEEACLKVGLTKVGAVLQNRREAARKIAQRLPRDIGIILLNVDRDLGAAADEEKEVLDTIHDLVNRNKLDKKYVDALFTTPIDSVQLKSTGA